MKNICEIVTGIEFIPFEILIQSIGMNVPDEENRIILELNISKGFKIEEFPAVMRSVKPRTGAVLKDAEADSPAEVLLSLSKPE